MNKKRYAIALVLFLLIGLTAFSFANPLNDNNNGNGNDENNNQIGEVVETNWSNDQTNTNDTSLDDNQNVVNNITLLNVNRNPVNNQNENNQNENNPNEVNEEEVDNSYNLALAAVINAENTLDNDAYNTALDLVNKITTNTDQINVLLGRLEVVKKIIDIRDLVSRLENQTLTATDIEEMNSSRDFRKVQEIVEKVDALEDSSVKSELKNKLNDLSEILDDLDAPTINIVDGSILGVKPTVLAEDTNDFTMVLTDNINNFSNRIENGYVVEEGSYTLTIIDAAFNETTVNFIVDLTAPKLTLNGETNIVLEAGIDTYTELGATVTDNFDETINNLQPKFIHYSVDGDFIGSVDTVDNTKPGLYKIQYEYTDRAGNVGVDANRDIHTYVIRVVTVQDTTTPKIILNGATFMTLEAGIDKYEELGATVTDNLDATITNLQPVFANYSVNGKFQKQLSTVDTTKPGLYKVVYKYTDAAGNVGVDPNKEIHDYVMRYVTVVDTTAPRMTLNGEENITLEAGIDTYTELGVTVTDNVDPTFTMFKPKAIKYYADPSDTSHTVLVDAVDPNVIGTYKLIYSYKDANKVAAVDINNLSNDFVMRTVTVQDTISPKMTLNGEANITLEAGIDTYEELGVTVTDNNNPTFTMYKPMAIKYYADPSDTSHTVLVDAVDPNVIGTYKLIYSYKDANKVAAVDINNPNNDFVMRTVVVQDTTAPKLTLNGESNIILRVGIDTYEELGATVTDNVDETKTMYVPKAIKYYADPSDTSHTVVVNAVDTNVVGTYKLIYNYKDAAGNAAVDINNPNNDFVMRTVTVSADTIAPILVLNGDAYVTVEAGTGTYTELGATMTDNEDETNNNIQPDYINYKVSGQPTVKVNSVDTKKPGLYEVFYKYTDKAGNEGIDKWYSGHNFVERFVTVQDTTAPQISMNGDGSMTLVMGQDIYTELGATVTDNVDATITNLQPSFIEYKVDGELVGRVNLVDMTVPGVYEVVYECADAAGNAGVSIFNSSQQFVKRIVIVTE